MDDGERFSKWNVSESQLRDCTPATVRDLIVECFYVAQGQTFRRVKEQAHAPCAEKNIIDSIAAVVRLAFSECQGDFNNPSKESLQRVIVFLSKQAATWGTPQDIIEHHLAQIQKAIDRLAENDKG